MNILIIFLVALIIVTWVYLIGLISLSVYNKIKNNNSNYVYYHPKSVMYFKHSNVKVTIEESQFGKGGWRYKIKGSDSWYRGSSFQLKPEKDVQTKQRNS